MFTKLHAQIITSSIWNEPDHVRLLWITMLALSDENGFVGASVGGLAHTARMEVKKCEDALRVLSSPDEDSRTKEFDGCRIGETDGGWFILNYEKFRARRDKEQRREYMREYMRNKRKNGEERDSVNNVNSCKPQLAQAEAEAEADLKIYIARVVGYLNSKARTNYRLESRKTTSLIKARIKEGFTAEDFEVVIDKKCRKWLSDPKMVSYLRPETLFGTKFESYLNEPKPAPGPNEPPPPPPEW